MTGSKSKLSFLPLPEDDLRQRQPDISRAQETLGWVPKVSLADGFWHTIVYFDTLLSEQAMRSAERQGSPHD
jgi:UDP-glucuronate decarboxylase